MTPQSMTSSKAESGTKRPMIQKLMVVLGMVSIVVGTLTGIMTAVNLGITETYLNDWLSSFAMAILFIAPFGFLLMTLVNKLADLILASATNTQKNIAVGVIMAFIMESIMSASTALNNIGLNDISVFVDAWLQGFIVALPFGLVMTVIMAVAVKPRLERFMAS